jgi:hypothetical protein
VTKSAHSSPSSELSRRTVFLGASTAGAAAALATLARTPGPDAVAIAVERPVPPERGGGYHLSEHVKRYYKTTTI